MWYGDKREAKVMIMSVLIEKGWKVFGYKEDRSDSMSDYYDPASWEGIAEKNGYVLLVDVYGNGRSGQEIKERNPDASKVNHDKIRKLQAKANDMAAPEAEREACRSRIAVEMAKLSGQYIVTDRYPVFTTGNPKNSSWHIEKDGQIIAKGNGVFACNEYDWEDKTRTAAQQKKEKIEKLINRFEKVLRDTEALETEVVKVEKKVMKPVEVNKTSITFDDYKLGLMFVMKVNYTNGNNKGTKYSCTQIFEDGKNSVFSKVGRSGKVSKAQGSGWFMSVEKMNTMLSKGHIAIVEMQEFTEYEEKVVYKKTARKQKQDLDITALTGEMEEVAKQETAQTSVNASYTLNNELNGVEVSFTNKPEQSVIDALKSNGFRWHKFKKVWYATQTESRLAFVKSLYGNNSTQEEGHPETQETNVTESQEAFTVEHVAETILDYSFNIYMNENGEKRNFETEEEKAEYKIKLTESIAHIEVTSEIIECVRSLVGSGLLVDTLEQISGISNNSEATQEPEKEQYSNVVQFPQQKQEEEPEIAHNSETAEEQDDLLNMFEQVEIENHSRISEEDLEYCNRQHEQYRMAITVLETALQAFKSIAKENSYIESYHDITPLENRIEAIKERYIKNICWHFSGKYNVSIEQNFSKKYDTGVTYEQILDEIFIQLGGYSFEEKAVKEIKDNMKQLVTRWGDTSKYMEVKGNKISFDSLYIVSYCSIFKRHEIGYNSRQNAIKFFQALTNFDNGQTEIHWELDDLYLKNKAEYLFEKHDLSFNKIKTIKMFKNGRIDIEFSSNELAKQFAREYCGYSKAA